jgi:hypothetical protein
VIALLPVYIAVVFAVLGALLALQAIGLID